MKIQDGTQPSLPPRMVLKKEVSRNGGRKDYNSTRRSLLYCSRTHLSRKLGVKARRHDPIAITETLCVNHASDFLRGTSVTVRVDAALKYFNAQPP